MDALSHNTDFPLSTLENVAERATRGNPHFIQTEVDNFTVKFYRSEALKDGCRIANVFSNSNVNSVVAVFLTEPGDTDRERVDSELLNSPVNNPSRDKHPDFLLGWNSYFDGKHQEEFVEKQGQ